MWVPYGLIAAWIVQLAGSVLAAWWFLSRLGSRVALASEPTVVVIAPVKGASRHLGEFVRLLRSQAYGRYRILAVVEADDDSAVPVLREGSGGPGAPLEIAVAGLSVDEGQKVHNQLHAIGRLGPDAEIAAFVDADTLPDPDWLLRLVEPLTRGIDVVTGHRWPMPVGGDVPSGLAAAATVSIVTVPRIAKVVWGGTFALRRSTMDRIGMADRLKGSVVDDVHLTRILHEHGLRILTPRDLVVRSPVEHSLASALAYGRRQYFFVRWYLPHVWCAAALLTTLPLVAGLAATILALSGDAIAIASLVAAIALGQARATFRGRIVRKLWDRETYLAYRKTDPVVRWGAPAWTILHALAVWTTAFSRLLRWAGVTYELKGYAETVILERRSSPRTATPGARDLDGERVLRAGVSVEEGGRP